MSIFKTAWIRASMIIASVSLILFLTLPYPFMSSPIRCNPKANSVMSNCKIIETTKWHWLGGYHIVIERFFVPMDGMERQKNINKYYGITRGGVATYGLISLFLSAVLYAGANRIVKNKTQRSRMNDDL